MYKRQTECSPVISNNVSWNIKKESVGQLLPNCQAKSVDGELWVRGSSVMQGYYKMPEETKETLEGGWLKTGDLGYVDEDGFVFLTGRKTVSYTHLCSFRLGQDLYGLPCSEKGERRRVLE